MDYMYRKVWVQLQSASWKLCPLTADSAGLTKMMQKDHCSTSLSFWTGGEIGATYLSALLCSPFKPFTLSIPSSLPVRSRLWRLSCPPLHWGFLHCFRKLQVISFWWGAPAIQRHSTKTRCKVETHRHLFVMGLTDVQQLVSFKSPQKNHCTAM